MKRLIVLIAMFTATDLHAQDLRFAKSIVDTLTSDFFWGRGYTKDGMKKAADFLSNKFKSFGLEPMSSNGYLQHYNYPVNTFPGKMELKINGKDLVPGADFIIGPESRGIKGKGSLIEKDSVSFINMDDRVVIQMEDKLTWSVSQEVADYTLINVNKNALTSTPKEYKANIENEFLKNFSATNVCGMVRGTAVPDSFLFITAHYDHLGGMGNETFFPGANDNASGISLLLNLARYYAKHPLRYSVGFICFAGEEAGMTGSKYFTENPLVPLSGIRFLTNTDLAGTGEEGITVVNATEYPLEFSLLNSINDEQKLLTKIGSRGKAANSDHYFFSEKGVPAFFFYTMGGIKAYHDIWDKAATLPLNEHEDLFRLVTSFYQKLIAQ